MDATERPQLPFEAEAIQHAEADTHHAHARCHALSEVQLPSGLHRQSSLVMQAAASPHSIPADCMTANSQSVFKVRIATK